MYLVIADLDCLFCEALSLSRNEYTDVLKMKLFFKD